MAASPQTLWKRKISLIVFTPSTLQTTQTIVQSAGSADVTVTGSGTAGNALDLSAMRITFKITAQDAETPNEAIIRIYNLSDTTAQKIAGEFQMVQLKAGYENGPFGVVFQGTIKQVMFGHETNIDSYVDIFAADSDIAYNYACVSSSLAASATTPAQLLSAMQSSMAPYGVTNGYVMDLPPSALARGKVSFGLARDGLRDLANRVGASWSIQNGALTLIPLAGYIPGEAIVLTSATGMVGFPQQTPGGITVRSLLNPNIKIGGLIQINNKAINQGLSSASGAALYPASGRLEALPGYLAKISSDGFYKVLVHECEGDVRGQEWYSDLTCLAVDMSAPAGQQVSPYWAGGPKTPNATVTLGAITVQP